MRNLLLDATPETPLAPPVVAREALYARYERLLQVNPDLSRGLVSYQANKEQPFYRWFKYKEGFSSALVKHCLGAVGGRPGVLLDPFAGSGAALFASQELGWCAQGIELLPVGAKIMEARAAAQTVRPADFAEAISRIGRVDFEKNYRDDFAFRHIAITQGAFSEPTERQMAGYLAYCQSLAHDPNLLQLLRFACLCVLEEVSYTRKDGQYLRWDNRSPKKTIGRLFDKGHIPSFRDAVLLKLQQMAEDIESLSEERREGKGPNEGPEFKAGTCLQILPAMRSRTFDAVFTSPPYCNRYDYTRTYALELAFLGYTSDQVKELRQTMLSCTVENKEKEAKLREMYRRIKHPDRYQAVRRVFENQKALQEVLKVLQEYASQDRLNNYNVPRMVRNYFFEMAFVVCELSRILRPGGHVVMVNDNVRYAGEEVPVDLIVSDFAAQFGLRTKNIWVLPRGKGNSSQQMGCHGRHELRKCVYVWEKPHDSELTVAETKGKYRAR
jgi:Tfp pilus assembly protein PilZ